MFWPPLYKTTVLHNVSRRYYWPHPRSLPFRRSSFYRDSHNRSSLITPLAHPQSILTSPLLFSTLFTCDEKFFLFTCKFRPTTHVKIYSFGGIFFNNFQFPLYCREFSTNLAHDSKRISTSRRIHGRNTVTLKISERFMQKMGRSTRVQLFPCPILHSDVARNAHGWAVAASDRRFRKRTIQRPRLRYKRTISIEWEFEYALQSFYFKTKPSVDEQRVLGARTITVNAFPPPAYGPFFIYSNVPTSRFVFIIR